MSDTTVENAGEPATTEAVRRPGAPDRETVLASIRASGLEETEKTEFAALLPRLPENVLREIAVAVEADAREALKGARFSVEMESVTSKLDAFEEKVRGLAGAVVKAGKKREEADAESEKRAATAVTGEIL